MVHGEWHWSARWRCASGQRHAGPTARMRATQTSRTRARRRCLAARVIPVDGINFAYEPSQITAAPGEQITIAMTSVEDRHDLVLLLGAESLLIAWASEGVTAVGGLTAPSEPGVYRFICSEIGHLAEGMEGQLVVE